ncbi:MAG: YdcF family protein [Chloroflexi bacterium]|nr:YdcF family protein [Chloroflexota bacterium]
MPSALNPDDYILVPKRALRRASAGLMLTLALALTFHSLWLPLLAQALIVDEPLQQADAIVVLGGGIGDREATGARLFTQGYAPLVITTGGEIHLPGLAELTAAGLAADELESRGVPPPAIIQLTESQTTCDDARLTLAALPGDSKRVILVTDPFHTRRAQWLFNRAAPELDVIAVAASPSWFDPAHWWATDIGIIVVAQEYVKFAVTLAQGCNG